MLTIGLTGGIGTGKSTVASLFARRGAHVVDVDALGRSALEPGSAAYEDVLAAFGPAILDADGSIDRAALGREVFGARNRLAELEAISHPAINRELVALTQNATAALMVLDMAVLTESRLGWVGDSTIYQRVVVVEAPEPMRFARLADRGMTEQQARDRMAVQANDKQRRLRADLVIVNDGCLGDLDRAVNTVWPTIEAWVLQSGGSRV